jgi:hypothetical protein
MMMMKMEAAQASTSYSSSAQSGSAAAVVYRRHQVIGWVPVSTTHCIALHCIALHCIALHCMALANGVRYHVETVASYGYGILLRHTALHSRSCVVL